MTSPTIPQFVQDATRQVVRQPAEAAPAPSLDIVVPVFNEQAGLEASIRRLHAYLVNDFPFSWQITIVDNASTDETWPLACRLARELVDVDAIQIGEKGRGRALHCAWGNSDAAVLAYMDVDLSTDLAALLPLVAPLLSGHSDVAIGSRLAHGARVVRGTKRELISRCYNAILRATLGVKFSDAQCGFKAIRHDRAEQVLPLVQDQGWFFDTELLVLAERSGLRIHEVPVDWVDDPQSSVDVVATAVADLRGVVRLMRMTTLSRQIAQFVTIGIVSTVAYVALYLALRSGLAPLAANALSLAITAVANTAANRRVTFGVSGRTGMLRDQVQGLAVFGLALLVTSGAIGALHAVAPRPSRAVEIVTLLVANGLATAMRFLLLRQWVFRRTTA